MERSGSGASLIQSGSLPRPTTSPLSLVDLLLQIEDQQPSRKLLLLLFDSLVNSNFSTNHYHLIRNASAANVLLSILPRAPLPIQVEALTNLTKLCEVSMRNCHVLCESGALKLALDILPSVQNEVLFEKLLTFATTLGAYNMNPPEVKSFILAMRKMLEASRTSRISALSKSMQKMLKRLGHVSAFSFDASKDCGLLLPPFPMPSGGYTLCFWLKVEHMPSTANHFRTFSLLNEEGDGLTVWISEKHGQILINVANYSSGTVTTQFFEQAPLQLNKWYHIALSHIPKVFVFGRSEMKLFVNGNMKQSKNLGYLSYSKPMSKSWIGSDSEITFSSIPSELCISGQMNCIAMYNDALSDERVANIALLSPDNPRQLAYLQGANLVWLYHPQATERGIAFDVGPWSLHSAKVGDLVSASCLTVQDALFSAGGIQLLSPFLHHLVDLAQTPMEPPADTNSLVMSQEKQPAINEVQSLCCNLVELIGDILLLSETHRQDALRSNAIGLMGFILEEIARDHFGFQFLVMLDHLVTEMLSIDVHVAQELYLKIFFNFRIWCSTPFDLQKQWMLAVIRHVGNNPVYFRDKFGVQDILDSMQTYYSYPDNREDGVNSFGLSFKQVGELRSMLGYVLRTVTHGDINEPELKSILSFVLESPRAAEVVDVLNALVWFAATAPKNTYDALRKIGDITIFFGLLHHSDERVRISIIKIVSFILSNSYTDLNRQKVVQQQVAPWLLSAFNTVYLTEECYTTLAELLLGKPQFPENSDRFDVDSTLTFRQFDIEGNLRIANPDIAPVILRMSKNAASELQIKIFQDFLALLSHGKLNEISASNCAALSQREDWAVPLLDVLELIERRKRNAAATIKDKEVLNDVHIMVASLINAMLLLPMITKKDGWKSVAKFIAIADSYRTKLRVTKLLRIVFSNLMASLKGELTKIEAAAASAAAAEALASSNSPGGLLGSPAGQLVSAAVSSIGSLGSTVGATLSAGAAAVGASSSQQTVPHTVTRQILYEATAHLIFFVEEFLYLMPEKLSYTQLEVPANPETVIDAGDAHRMLRGSMHRSKHASPSTQFSNSPLSEQANLEEGQRKWKDFNLATQMMDLFDAFTATSAEQLVRVDTSAFFNRERSHVLFAVLRVLVSLLLEAPIVNDVKAIREKLSALRTAQVELGGPSPAPLRSSVEVSQDFERKRFQSFVDEKIEELMKQGKAIEHFYQRCAERCRIVLLFVKQHHLFMVGAKGNAEVVLQNVIIHVMNQLLTLFKSMIGGNDPLFLAIGGHLRGIIMENMQGVLDSCLPAGVPNPFSANAKVFEKSAPMRDLVSFVQETLATSPETMERLALATRSIEAAQLASFRAVLESRVRVVGDVRAAVSKLVHDQDDYLQRTIRTHTSLVQKVSLKEAQRRVSRGYSERKSQDALASLFAYTWKLMNDCSSVWKDFLIQVQPTEANLSSSSSWSAKKSSAFTKIDKSEQVMRVRAKIKKNYRGKQHTEASFSYLKSKWKKDADELRQRQIEASKKLQELESAQSSSSSTTSPRASSLPAPEIEPESPHKESTVVEQQASTSTPRSGSIGPNTPVRTPSTPGGRNSTSLSKAKSKIVSIETEVDEMMENIDTDDFTLLDSEATLDLDKNVEANDLVFSSKCEIIYPEVSVSGRLDVTKTTIYFFFDRERVTVQKSPSSDELSELAAGISSFGSPASSPPRSRSPSSAGDIGPADYRKWTKKMFGQKIRDREWQIDDIVGIYSRRYLLNWTALEIFFDNNRNYLLNLPKDQNRALHKALVTLKPKRLRDHYFATGAEMFKKRQDITEKWRRREISNFEYLMHLNELASRTYNDLTQYPVFPWILSNYSSDRIDLSDPKNYRDLRLPVGALDPDRFSKFQERFENFIDDQIPPFHYGSHYSSAGTTLFFLIRMEPFTSQFICLQGGKFDYPDRLFSSVPEAWENVLKSTTDVKELVPEFFCMPDFLQNRNGFDFGVKSNGKRIGDVELPGWAKTPEEFIRIQREALESEIVSQNLHHWIDLIFGCKQRGEQAVAARNTFYYLTYEGAVDLDSLWNPVQKKAIMDQIENFGQTPAQLLTTPHPQREPPRGNLHVWYPLSSEVPPFVFAHTQYSYQQLPYNSPFFLFAGKDRIVTCNTYGEYLIHKWDIAKQLLAHENDSPMRLEIDEQYSTSSSLSSLPASVTTHVQKMRLTDAISKRALAGSNRRLDLLNVTHHTISCRPRFLTLPEDPMVVLSYNHWDNTIQVSRFEEANATKSDNGVTRAQQAISAHKRPVTCAAIDKLFLVTGSADGSAAIWRCDYKRRDRKEGFGIITPALYTIHCHTTALTAVAINRDWDIIVTGSEDGVLSVHHLDLRHQDTRAVISLGACISSIVISPVDGSFVVYTSPSPLGTKRLQVSVVQPNCLYRYSINAELLAELNLASESKVQPEIASMIVTGDGKYLITAGGVSVAVRRLFDLATVYSYQGLPGDAFSAALDPEARALFVSTTDGKIVSYCKRDGSVLLP